MMPHGWQAWLIALILVLISPTGRANTNSVAMALGKLVLATRTAGTTDYIRHGENGLLVTPNDATELRAAVDRLMADGHLRAKLGNAARADIVNKHLPHHYSRMVRARLLARNSRLCSPRATATT